MLKKYPNSNGIAIKNGIIVKRSGRAAIRAPCFVKVLRNELSTKILKRSSATLTGFDMIYQLIM